ncbi:hypothetical protein OM427_18465 [Halomonas sp. 18H]|nr:hypothetical protein [Halomonas sp. 18H]MCW4151512.1 hypothetical protein [Halomonas sp. 18H]
MSTILVLYRYDVKSCRPFHAQNRAFLDMFTADCERTPIILIFNGIPFDAMLGITAGNSCHYASSSMPLQRFAKLALIKKRPASGAPGQQAAMLVQDRRGKETPFGIDSLRAG